MKKIYIFLFIGILAIVLIVVSLLTFDPKVETWTSLFGGAAIGFFIVGAPSLWAWYKKRQQNKIK